MRSPVKARNPFRPLLLWACLLVVVGCDWEQDGYLPLSAISSGGFASDAALLPEGEVRVWGYVDAHNIFATGAESLLGEWWGGDGPSATRWRFGLKARPDDPPGHSVPVAVPEDPLRDALLRRFADDASAGRPTRVFLRGRVRSFDAPANLRRFTGLTLEVDSTADLILEHSLP